MVRPIPQVLYSYTCAETLTCHLIFILPVPSSSLLPSASVPSSPATPVCRTHARFPLTCGELEAEAERTLLPRPVPAVVRRVPGGGPCWGGQPQS